MKKNSQN